MKAFNKSLRAMCGFSTVELLLGLAVLACGAAIIVPSWFEWRQLTLRAEVPENLRTMYEGAVVHASRATLKNAGGRDTAAFFPSSQGVTPSISCCHEGKRTSCLPGGRGQTGYNPAEWSTYTWKALNFQLKDPHLFRYAFEVSPDGNSVKKIARGDLDCDGNESRFWREATVRNDKVEGSREIFSLNEDE